MDIEGPLHAASASQLAAAIRTGVITSRDAVEACLARIDAVNPSLNAVIRQSETALAEADQADAVLARGQAAGVLHGVPYTLKDSIDTAGLVTTAGTVGWRERVPERDATVAARLRAAGGILLGKTNTPEFTWSNETSNDLFGRTSNPYDVSRSTGGSSGGSAAIVAAAGAPFDIGSDTADSIRLPSHYCGVAGLKPTQGRVSRAGHNPSFQGIIGGWTQLGPIARSVQDLELVLSVIAGPDGLDPQVPPMPLLEAASVDVAALRVALVTDNGAVTPSPEVVAGVEAAAAALSAAGASVDRRVPPGLAELGEIWWTVAQADGHAWLRRHIAAAGTPGDGSYDWLSTSIVLPSAELTRLLERIDDLRAGMLRFLDDIDLIVSPAGPYPAFPHGAGGTDLYADTYCEPYNLTGWPAGVVRAGTSPEGLPLGVQVAAGPWREDRVLAALAVIEAATGGWSPPPL